MASDTKNPAEVFRALTKALGEKLDSLSKSDKLHKAAGDEVDVGLFRYHDLGRKCQGPGCNNNLSAFGASGKPVPQEAKDKVKYCSRGCAHDAKKASEKAKASEDTKKSEYSAAEVGEAIRKATIARIDAFKLELQKMERAEELGRNSLKKNIGDLPSQTPSTKEIADGDPDMDKAEKMPNKGKYAGDAEGSGGQVKKGKLFKQGMGMSAGPKLPSLPKVPTAKPAGSAAPPSSGPKPAPGPKPPKTPGIPAAKMELPQTPEKANGGQMGKMELPQTPEKANGGQMGKMELPQSSEKANGGQMGKMELPQTPENANGGQEIAKGMMSMHPSPVFKVRPRLGGKDAMSTHMSHAASQAAAPATAPSGKVAKMPSPEEHAARANMYFDAMNGAFGKAEMDSLKCPSCKKGATLCKC